jgi:hypothetical protein
MALSPWAIAAGSGTDFLFCLIAALPCIRSDDWKYQVKLLWPMLRKEGVIIKFLNKQENTAPKYLTNYTQWW